MSSPLVWRRTRGDLQYDFEATFEGRTIGRIYRHFDKIRWQWFFQLDPASSGIVDDRQKAIDAIKSAFEAKMKSPAAGGPRGS